MTLWGIDVSNHQGDFDFAAARREGYVFATHKITEGDFYADPFWPRALNEMRKHFPGTFGGYHFWRKSSGVERQADFLAAKVLDKSVPIQLDFEDEKQPRGTVTRGDLDAILKAISERGLRVFANYMPRWYWRDYMGSPDLAGTPPLWNSDYGNNRSGFGSAIYPGPHDWGWQPFGGHPVKILQFSEKGHVAGLKTVDVNAFEGSEDELRALFAGKKPATDQGGRPVTPEDAAKQIVTELVGLGYPQFKGWEILGRSIVAPDRSNTLVEALAEIRDQLGGPNHDLKGWPQLGGRTLVDAVALLLENQKATDQTLNTIADALRDLRAQLPNVDQGGKKLS